MWTAKPQLGRDRATRLGNRGSPRPVRRLLIGQPEMAPKSSAHRKSREPTPPPALAPSEDAAARSGPLLQLVPNLRDGSASLAGFSDLEVDFFRRGDELEEEQAATA